VEGGYRQQVICVAFMHSYSEACPHSYKDSTGKYLSGTHQVAPVTHQVAPLLLCNRIIV